MITATNSAMQAKNKIYNFFGDELQKYVPGKRKTGSPGRQPFVMYSKIMYAFTFKRSWIRGLKTVRN